MPTPVSSARQCLTQEAAQALDNAVSVSRRRCHAQTTSLHAVSALLSLSLSSSTLREACARTGSYSGRVQFKALDLCLGVALDRLPARNPRRGKEDESEEGPPVSNSLMAAIRRSQANQKRMPESFSFSLYQDRHHQHSSSSSSSSSVSMVKVELQNLVLSILDDPVVSRVFGEAGFRTCDIKLAILRPLHQLLRYSRYRGPPMFLCNLTDENFRRIGNVLMRPKGRNPILIGSCASEALHSFCETVEKRKGGYLLPVEMFGLNVFHMGPDISKFLSDNYNEEMVKMRFKEIGFMVEQCNGPGLIISYGDVAEFIADKAMINVLSCIIGELTRLLDLYGAKVWLIGAAATYECFLKFLNKFTYVVRDWDLQLLPITSLRPSSGEAHHKSSVMESFVPFGGLLSSSSDLRIPFVGLNQCPSRCHLCNEKCEKEIQAISKPVFTASVVEQFHSNIPSSLQMNEWSTNTPLEVAKATDEHIPWSDKVKVMQQNWDNICQHLHHTSQLMTKNLYQSSSQVPLITGHSISIATNGSSNISECVNISSQPNNPLSGLSTELGQNFISQMKAKTSSFLDLDLNVLGSHSFSSCSTGDGQKSPPSATSVATDIDLQTHSSSPKSNKQFTHQSPPCFHRANVSNFDLGDFKTLNGMLSEKISWQEEAVSAISKAIARCRTNNQKRFGNNVRGDIWFTFTGPDYFSKKKIAVALAEILYGSKGNFIRVDLGSHDRDLKGHEVSFRGKNVADHVAWELSKKPFSVVFLENIDEADLMVQKSLSQALRTGKFPDSHGREVSINNTIFVATSMFCKSEEYHNSSEESSNFTEEHILRESKWPLQMVINCRNDSVVSNTSRTLLDPSIVNKRKSMGVREITKRAHKDTKIHLDLNFPPKDIELHEIHGVYEENSRVWFEDFIGLVDETVVFKPFDFQKYSEKVTKEIDSCFYSVFASSVVLEVDTSTVDHILVAMYLSEKNEVEDWLKEVLTKGFVEAQKMYNLVSPCIVKLISREGFDTEEKNLRCCLPPQIIVE